MILPHCVETSGTVPIAQRRGSSSQKNGVSQYVVSLTGIAGPVGRAGGVTLPAETLPGQSGDKTTLQYRKLSSCLFMETCIMSSCAKISTP